MLKARRTNFVVSSMRMLAAVSALAGIMSGCAGTAGMSGRLILPGLPKPTANAPAQKQAVPGAFGAQDAVISVVAEGRRVKPTTRRPRIEENGEGFDPRVLAVPVGAEVEFLNRDHVYHKAFSISPVKRFNLGAQAPGETHSIILDRVGVVKVYCELHPAAVGFVVILPNDLFTKPNARGEFAFPELGEGNYTVKVWHPIYGKLERQVSVPRGGELGLELAY